MPDDFVPRIADDLRDEMFRRVIARVRAAWDATKERRADFARFEEQVRGIASQGDGPWPDSCMLCDTLTTQESLTLRANIAQALNAHQIATCEPTQDGDDDAASDFEKWCNGAFFEAGGRRHLADVDTYAVNRRVAFSHVSWQQREEKVRGWQYIAPDGTAVQSWERQEGVDYRAEPVVKNNVVDGFVFRAPEPAHVFTDPPNAPDLQACRGVGEWMDVTPEDLLRGVDEQAYDEEAVLEVIRHHSAPVEEEDSPDTIVEAATGHQETQQDDRPLQIVTWIGTLPLWWDGDKLQLADLQAENYLFVVAIQGDSGTVLKWASWPYARRPYVRWNINNTPNSLDGICLPEMLEPVQAELDAHLRSTIDAADMETTPAMWAPEQHVQTFGYPQIKPGGTLTYSPQYGKPEPVEWDKAGVMVDIQLGAALRSLGKEVSSAQFSQQPLPGDTTATEVAALYGGLNAKFDLYLNTMLSSVEELVLLMAEIAAYHAPEAGLAFYVGNGQSVTVTGDMLQKRYRIQPYATSDQANPQLRLQKAMLKQKVQTDFFAASLQYGPMMPAFLRPLWHGAKHALMALGERMVEAWIGPEPPSAEEIAAQQQAAQAQALVGQIGALASGAPMPQPGAPQPGAPQPGMNGNGAQPGMMQPNGAQAGGAM